MTLIEKIKLAFRVNGIIGNELKEIKTMDIKSGWKTSEFWGKVAVQATAIWAAVGSFVPPKYAAIIVVSAEGIYMIGRTILKIYQTVKGTETTVVTSAPQTTVTVNP